MKAWIVRVQPFADCSSDYTGFVVRAEDEQTARAFASAEAREHPHGDPWTDRQLSTCEELSEEGRPGIILRERCSESWPDPLPAPRLGCRAASAVREPAASALQASGDGLRRVA